MVTTERNSDPAFWRLVIEPNCSFTWRQSMAFLLGTGLISLAIALAFALKGYWMIFPFAGLELAALAASFYVVACSARRRQVVSIFDASITVEKGKARRGAGDGGPESRAEFPRCWTRVEMTDGRAGRTASRLYIGAYGQRVELAEFLAEDEKRGLASQLRDLISGPGAVGPAAHAPHDRET